MNQLIIFAFCLFIQAGRSIDHWTYHGSTGIDNWSSMFPSCKGSRQSPININPFKVQSKNFPPIVFENYDVFPVHNELRNSGHTLRYSIDGNAVPFITGGDLGGKFKFYQMHLHWGGDSSRGSEHLIANVKFAGEMHLVHVNEKYADLHEARERPDGIAVIGILLESSCFENAAFEPIIEMLPNVLEPHTNTSLRKPVILKDLLPPNTEKFYRYSGSLTTPTCDESVTWTVLDTPVLISERQLDQLRTLYSEDGRPMVDNFRPPQPINDRIIYFSTGSFLSIFNDLNPAVWLPKAKSFLRYTKIIH